MKITISMLLNKLSHYKIYPDKITSKESASFYGISMINKKISSYDTDILYLVERSFFSSLTGDKIPLNILCIGDFNTKEIITTYNCNLITLHTEYYILDIFQEISLIFSYYNKWSDHLTQALIENKGIQSLTDIAYEIFNNPFTIVDSSQKLLAYTKNDQCEDFEWKDTLEKGYVSLYGSQVEGVSDLVKKAKHANAPVLFVMPNLKQPFLMTDIKIDKKSVGTFNLMAKNRQITQSDRDLSVYFCMILSLEFQKHELITLNKGIVYSNLITELLDDQDLKEEDIAKRMKYLNWTQKKSMNILTITTNKLNVSNKQLSNIREHLRIIIPTSKSVIYNGNIVLILESLETFPFNKSDLQIISNYLKEKCMNGGFSQSFHNIMNISKEYRHSLKAIDLGLNLNNKQTIFFYSNYSFLHLTDILSEQEDIKDFCHPALFKLIEFDKKNSTSFTNTLYIYLKNGKSPTKTAKELNFHRSSLNYRINKIKEILEIDLNDSEKVFDLQLSFKLLNYT